MYLLSTLFCYILFASSEFILNDDTTWMDDFAYDSLGENGWNIHQISGYSIPITNPTVLISNTPKYHGPFPSSYAIERHISCNTTQNTRLFISFLTSYCNTNKKDDYISFTITDPSNRYTLPTFATYKFHSQQPKPFNSNDLPFIQNATADYYTNHSSSTSITPQCATHTSQWYTSNTYKSYQLTIQGKHKYKIIIEMLLSDDKDEYVAVSNIAFLCVQVPTFNSPTIKPTLYTTTNSITNTQYTISSEIHAPNSSGNIYQNGKQTHDLKNDNYETTSESYMLSAMVDSNRSDAYKYINISDVQPKIFGDNNFELERILLYGLEIFVIVSFCCVCACIAACTSVYINNKLNALKAAKNLKLKQNNKIHINDINDIIRLIPQLQMVATASCPCKDDVHNVSDSECNNINNKSSNAASIDINGLMEGDVDNINNQSFRNANKVIDCQSFDETVQLKIIDKMDCDVRDENENEYNNNARSEMEFFDNEGNELNDDAGSDEENKCILDTTSPR